MSYRRYYTPRRESGERHARNLDPNLQLERDRIRNDLTLKGRFERIFDKYAKDFSNVGDEIDMESGAIVVDNGHLAFMQHERDVGSDASAQFVRAFADEVLGEGNAEGADGDDGEDEDEGAGGGREEMDDGSEDDLAPPKENGQGKQPAQDDEEEDELSIHHPGSQSASLPRSSRLQTPEPDHQDGQRGETDDSDEDDHGHLPTKAPRPDSGRSASPSHDYEQGQLASIVPTTETGVPAISIEQSLSALTPHQDASGRIDPAAVEQLGMSIAKQIADFLMHATAGRLNLQPDMPRNPWSVPPLPKDAFASQKSLEHGNMTPMPTRRRLPSMMESPDTSSLWAPVSDNYRPHKRRKNHHSAHGKPKRLLIEHANNMAGPPFSRGESIEPAFDSREGSEAPHAYESDANSRHKKKFEKYEDDLLRRLRDVDKLSWTQMTTYFPGRTPSALASRYTRALRYVPRPVIVKREIIEIVDSDDVHSQHTPNWRVLAPHDHHHHHHHPMPSPRRQPDTPLLRRALDSRLAEREGTPATVPDYSDTETVDAVPVYRRRPSPATPTYAYPPPGYYYPPPPPPPPPPPGQQGWPYPYNAFPPANGMWYPHMPSPARQETLGPKKRKYHGKPEAQARYTKFDTTQGDGRFGILRAETPTQMVSAPQQHLIGPRTAATGAFGVLKVSKTKPGKPAKAMEKAMEKANSGSRRRAEAEQEDGPTVDSPLPVTPLFAQMMPPPRPLFPPPAFTPVNGFATNDQHNPHVIRDESEEAPGSGTTYATPAKNGGPYFSSRASQNIREEGELSLLGADDDDDDDDDDDTLEDKKTNRKRNKKNKEPLSLSLPTPRSDPRVKASQTTAGNGTAPSPSTAILGSPARQSGDGAHAAPVAKMTASVYDTPRHPYASSPTPGGNDIGPQSVPAMRKTGFDDESEDELA